MIICDNCGADMAPIQRDDLVWRVPFVCDKCMKLYRRDEVLLSKNTSSPISVLRSAYEGYKRVYWDRVDK